MSDDLVHVLLTRFNVPSAGAEALVRAQDGWLRGRVGLFERYCLPSVARQTRPGARWVVYFDPESPDWLHDWVDGVAHGAFVPVFRERVSAADLLADLDRVTDGAAGPTARLLTTNLDNDDALAATFVERLQDGVRGLPARRHAVYLPQGLIRTDTALYRVTDRHNAFCSVVEPRADAVTCWADWHNRLPLTMPVHELPGPPGWLQVVHGSNVTNRVKGDRTATTTAYAREFGTALDGVRPPTPREVRYDRLVAGPGRRAEQLVRSGVKGAVLATLGTDGWDRTKARIAMARARTRSLTRHRIGTRGRTNVG